MRMGNSRSVVAGAKPGAKSGQGGFLAPFRLLAPIASPQDSSTPLLHYSIPHEIPCNLSRRFPLYRVEADGLPAKAAQLKEPSVDKNYKYRLLIFSRRPVMLDTPSSALLLNDLRNRTN